MKKNHVTVYVNRGGDVRQMSTLVYMEGGGVQKSPKSCVRCLCTAPINDFLKLKLCMLIFSKLIQAEFIRKSKKIKPDLLIDPLMDEVTLPIDGAIAHCQAIELRGISDF